MALKDFTVAGILCFVVLLLGVMASIPMIAIGAATGNTALWQAGVILFNVLFAILSIIQAMLSTEDMDDNWFVTCIGMTILPITTLSIVTLSVYMIVSGAVDGDSRKWTIGIILLVFSWLIGLIAACCCSAIGGCVQHVCDTNTLQEVVTEQPKPLEQLTDKPPKPQEPQTGGKPSKVAEPPAETHQDSPESAC